MDRVLLDAGPIVGIYSARDEHHVTCVDCLTAIQPPLFTCWPVIAEAAWLLRRDTAAICNVLTAIRTGFFSLLPLDASDTLSICEFLRRYRDIGAQLADAALMHLAEREDIDAIFTLDRRDFGVYRTRRGRRMRIVPE